MTGVIQLRQDLVAVKYNELEGRAKIRQKQLDEAT